MNPQNHITEGLSNFMSGSASCHQLAKFGGHRDISGRGVMFLVCHVIKQDHVIQGWDDYNDRSPTREVTILPSLVVIDTVVVWRKSLKVSHHPTKFGCYRHSGIEDIMILVCLVISQDQVIKGSCDFKGKSPSRQVNILPSLVVIGARAAEI